MWEGNWAVLLQIVGETAGSQGVTVCLSRVLTTWHAGDGWVVLKGDGQPVTGCDGRHPEA